VEIIVYNIAVARLKLGLSKKEIRRTGQATKEPAKASLEKLMETADS
jgi:hypothetical protein